MPENPYSAPATEFAGTATTTSGVEHLFRVEAAWTAGWGIRAVARTIDLVVQGLVSLVAAVVVAVTHAVVVGGGIDADLDDAAGNGLVLFFAGLAYHSVCDRRAQTTVGKLVCGLRVTTAAGRRPSSWAAFVRNAAFVLDAFLFGWVAHSAMAQSRLQQRVGDRMVDTVVVRRKSLPPEAVPGAGQTAVGIALGLCASFALQAVVVTLHVMR